MAEQERQHLPKNYSYWYLLCKQQSNLQRLQTKYREQDIKFTEIHVIMLHYSDNSNEHKQKSRTNLCIKLLFSTTVANAKGAAMQSRFYHLVFPDEYFEAGCFIKVEDTGLKPQ